MLRLQILLQAVDRLTAPMRAVEARLAAVGAAAQRIGRESGATRLAGAMGRVASSAGNAALAIGRVSATAAGLGAGAGIAGGIAFNRTFVRTAADFEDLQNALETTMESTEAAANALRYIDSWAARTPYTINEAATAFRRLTGAGQNAQQSMDSLGDAASGANVPLMQVTEAYLDAVTGQFERLRELGITAQREGDKVRLTYMRNGRQQAEVVNANNQAQVGSTLRAIWNRQYQGAMERRAGSWRGMLSMLEDAWTRFQKAVMDAGVFDWMKGQLEDLLKRIEGWSKDGSMQRWAEQTAASIMRAFTTMRQFLLGYARVGDAGPEYVPGLFERLPGILTSIEDAVTDIIGVFEKVRAAVERFTGPLSTAEFYLGGLALAVAAPLAVPLLALAAAIAKVVAALLPFTVAFAASPLRLFLTALGASLLLIVTYWDDIAEAARVAFAAISRGLGLGRAGQERLDTAPPPLGNVQQRQGAANAARRIDDAEWNAPEAPPPAAAANQPPPRSPFDLMNRAAGTAGGASSPATATTAPRPAAAAPPAPVRVETGGRLDINLHDNRAPQITGRPANPEERWSINQGPRLVTP
jgi:hypothetical protein